MKSKRTDVTKCVTSQCGTPSPALSRVSAASELTFPLAKGLPQSCHSDDRREEESANHHVDRPLAALGVTGGSKSLDRLSELLNAAYANIRFNAATGLAWHGDPHAAPVLLEMLDPDNSGLMEGELNNSKSPNSLTRQSVLESRQVLVIGSAIRAVNRLSRSGAEFDRERFRQTLTKITKSKLPKMVRTRATESLILLGKTAVKSAV